MALAPWRSPLARALHRNRSLPYARYFQLATVRLDGRPANRTVVFRGFREDTNQLQMVTDARSEKADQIAQSAWGEACWYFPTTREQFRLSGTLMLVQNGCPEPDLLKERQRSWQTLSDAARVQFTWPHPGQPRDNAGFTQPPPDPVNPLPQFCLLLLDPVQVDHLELRGEPQNRWIYSCCDGAGWTTEAVNP